MATVWKNRKGEVTHNLNESDEVIETPCLTCALFGEGVETCIICGEPNASGWWMGNKHVPLCRGCAIEKIPLLIADAIVGEHGDGPTAITNALRALVEIEGHFWRGVAIAVHRCSQVAAREAKQREAEVAAEAEEQDQGCACRQHSDDGTGDNEKAVRQ